MAKRPDEEHHLLRPFGDEVREQKGRDLAEAVHKIKSIDEAAKSAAAEFKQAKETQQTKALALSADLRMGKHLVPVQCRWVMSTHRWDLITEDGEVIRTEATTMADRQGELLS